jgi:hypothetical protein
LFGYIFCFVFQNRLDMSKVCGTFLSMKISTDMCRAP